MKLPRPRHVTLTMAVTALLLAGGVRAQAPGAVPGVYRCGDSYGSTPCPGGKPVAVDDRRSDEQRRQAQAVKVQDGKLARELAAERQARERAAVGLRAARLGPSEAERTRAEALAARDKAKADRELKKKPKRAPRAPRSA